MQSSPPAGCPIENMLKETCDSDPNWVWEEVDNRNWGEVESVWQEFYQHWRDSSASSRFREEFPYVLELGTDSRGASLLPFHGETTSENRILVTKSYNDIYNRLLLLRQVDPGTKRGVVLTGQPGTGKTIFLKFMLARLISAGQVVLLYQSPVIYLFYRGEVYSRTKSEGFHFLPQRLWMGYCPIWALIDGDCDGQEVSLGGNPYIWPIHVTSPNPKRWKGWVKQNTASLLGMPLWNVEELVEGLRLHPYYDKFLGELKLSPSPPKPPPIGLGWAIDGARKVLQEAREENENRDETGDGSRTPDPMDDMEKALKILVRDAVEEFGFIPRDVYEGILGAYDLKSRHSTTANNLDPDQLKEIVTSFSVARGFSFEYLHRVITVFPLPPGHQTYSDRWAIDFKSIRIARKVMKLMCLRWGERIWEMYGFFHEFPESSALAGWFFEAIVHRLFSSGWKLGTAPQPIPMDCKGPSDSPLFSTDPSSSTPGTLLSPLRPEARSVTQVNFSPRELSDVTLDSDKYYIPSAANHPLFDSFTIDISPPTCEEPATGIISIFQMTISKSHKGSAEGYPHIHKIMARVRNLLEKGYSNPTVKVVYFLVCPHDQSQHQWQMPVGWNKSVQKNDHCGKCFSIRVPVPGHHGPL